MMQPLFQEREIILLEDFLTEASEGRPRASSVNEIFAIEVAEDGEKTVM